MSVGLVSVTGTALQGVFVDSVNGNDSNGGTQVFPVQTLTHTNAIITAGQVMRAVTGSHWREEPQPTLNITVEPNGPGAIPIIDASDVAAASWTRPNAGTYLNVWSQTFSRYTPAGQGYFGLWADGVRPTVVAFDLATVNTTPGSMGIDNNLSATPTVYLYSTTNPNSNGVVFEYTKRPYGIYWYDVSNTVSVIGPLEIVKASDQYGCLAAGAGTYQQLLLRDAGIHHSVWRDGTFTDIICTEGNPGDVGVCVVAYRDVGAGWNPLITRGFCIFPGGAGRSTYAQQSSFLTHGSSSNPDSVTWDQCFVQGVDGWAANVTGTQFLTNCYAVDPYGSAVDMSGPTTVTRFLGNEQTASPHIGGSTFLSMTATSHVTDAAIYTAGVPSGSSTAGTVTTSALITPNTIAIQGTGAVTMNHTILGFGNSAIGASTGYVGDHNVFFWVGNGGFRAVWNGTTVTALATWQADTGQDANSVYVNNADQSAGNANAFWLGVSSNANRGPQDGDFRINPNARVVDASGGTHIGVFPDSTAITLAGPQTHWNYNTRASVAGPSSSWPTFPQTIADMRSYVTSPSAWVF